ncbi:MAG: hypothetical protein E7069_08005 [Bacteroidales bacterium]|nr:hypothetical protein [Bacteroidales bacterium]
MKFSCNRCNIVSQVAQLPTSHENGVGLRCHPERSEGSLSLGVGCAYVRAKSNAPALHAHIARTDNTD